VQTTAYIEYTLQLGFNCSLTLESCYPYRVDVVTCKCSVNKTVAPLLTTAGGESVFVLILFNTDEAQSSAAVTHNSNTSTTVIIASVVGNALPQMNLTNKGSVLFVLISTAIVVFVFIRKRNNKETSIEMQNQSKHASIEEKGEIEDIVIQKPIGRGNFSEVFYGVMLVIKKKILRVMKKREIFLLLLKS
jgi:hypothetical protein